MTNLSEFTFLSSDGKTQLHGMLWEPEGVAVRAVLQIVPFPEEDRARRYHFRIQQGIPG